MSKKAIVLATLIFTLTGTALALSTNLNTIQGTANYTDPGQFRLEIHNNDTEANEYSISLLSPKSSWFYHPDSAKIHAETSKTLNITVSPIQKAVQQKYRFDGKVREQKTGEISKFTGFFNVQQQYILHIIDLDQNKEELRPGEKFNTSIEIQNLNNAPIQDYNVQAKYKNQSKTSTGTQILSKGTRKYKYQFKTNKNASPSTEQIKYTLTANGKIQTTSIQRIKIKSTQDIQEDIKKSNNIHTTTKTVQIQNQGNTPVNTSATIKTSGYLESITTPEPSPDQKTQQNGTTLYTWNIQNLEPGEKFQATTNTKYWIPFTGITLLTLGILAIKIIGQNIQINKEIEENKENIKIRLEIENKSEETFENLKLEEFIPDIATVDENFDMNTPKIRKTTEGTKLTWSIEKLGPGDTRIIQYQIKPKIQVEEPVQLEKARLQGQNGETITQSNQTEAEFKP